MDWRTNQEPTGHARLIGPTHIEMPQNVQYDAAYISENIGIPISTARELTLEKAKKAAKAKKKRVGR